MSEMTPHTIDFAGRLLDALAEASAAFPGVTRDAYGTGEQAAHDIIRSAAEKLKTEIKIDAAGNLYMTRPGSDRTLPAIVFCSHLDSVPHGGNYDGAAGVVAGLAVIERLVALDIVIERDITVLATRSEEAVWFPVSYPGAKAALGLLPPAALEVCRIDTGKTLVNHLLEAGFDPVRVAAGEAGIRPNNIAAFVELHIEQGPRLLSQDKPLGIVTAINGGIRFPTAKCLGAYAHSGAEPRFSRKDSVLGFVDLATGLEAIWDDYEATGQELTITFGRVESDPAQHGGSLVLGEIGFSLDIRCEHQHILDEVAAKITELCCGIEARRSVRFDLGPRFAWPAATMDRALIEQLQAAAQRQNLPDGTLSSGAGHDTAVFAEAGVPSVMVFVRNANGSHNPNEFMAIEDLALGVDLLVDFVRHYAPAS
jgi:N-carbamoyl-L-amino-acid hydrolase